MGWWLGLQQPPWSSGFPNERNQGKQGRHPVLKYRVPHGSQGANPQPQSAGSQDNGHGKLVLPQLNRLHEAFKRSQVPPPASSSQDQPTRPWPIPSQRSLTQQLTKEWLQYKALRQCYAGTRFEEQRQLHLPQKHKATVPDSILTEMNGLEEQADNAQARELCWKTQIPSPGSWP